MRQTLGVVLREFAAECGRWLRRIRQRRELLQLDRLMLRDLGLSEADVWLEASKSPWQP